ncbi:hypothetical protein PG995_013211 [Apiospora arundinis]
MQFTTTIIAAALAFATGSAAWAQDQDGNWVANDTWYSIRGMPGPRWQTGLLLKLASQHEALWQTSTGLSIF